MAVQEVEAFFEAHKAYFENRDVARHHVQPFGRLPVLGSGRG